MTQYLKVCYATNIAIDDRNSIVITEPDLRGGEPAKSSPGYESA